MSMSISVPVAKRRLSIHTLSLQRAALLVLTPLALTLAGCGGGSGDAQPGNANLGAPATFTVDYGVKGYSFSWSPSAGATRYELFEDPDGATGPQSEVQIGGALINTTYAHSLAPQLLHERVNASYRVRACDASGCGAFSATLAPDLTKAIGYFKASNSGENDGYGASIALSADGSTLAVGAPGESSKATSVNGDQADNSVEGSGAVYVFARSGSGWSQQAYIKASNPKVVPIAAPYPASLGWAKFGASISLAADGSTLAVGAPGEASNARGINGDQTNSQAPGSGAVYVFQRSGGAWSQHAYVKASNTVPAATYRTDIAAGYSIVNAAEFGKSLSLSANGKMLAVGAPGEQSNATGINGNQDDTSLDGAGAVYVFALGTSWSQQAYVKASISAENFFGTSVSLSGDGRTLAVGGWKEAYVFAGDSGAWSQQARLQGSDMPPPAGTETRVGFFGTSTALAADGNTLAIGALFNPIRSGEFGVIPTAYVFVRSNGAWAQQAHLQAAKQIGSWISATLALSTDGQTLAMGTGADSSSSTGFNGSQAGSASTEAGATYLYQRSGATWSQRAYIKASNTDTYDRFGDSVALSGDGTTLAVGAAGEDSKATGIQGDESDNSSAAGVTGAYKPYASYGAVYLY